MRNYLHSIEGIDILEKHALQLKETIHNMEEDLTTNKALKKMRKKVIKSSKFLSSNIDTESLPYFFPIGVCITMEYCCSDIFALLSFIISFHICLLILFRLVI